MASSFHLPVGLKKPMQLVSNHLLVDMVEHLLTKISITYANEASVLNVALFGQTAADWRAKNKGKRGNIRDYATIQQLVILVNIESYNAEMIRDGMDQHKRLKRLNIAAITQLKSLMKSPEIEQLENK